MVMISMVPAFIYFYISLTAIILSGNDISVLEPLCEVLCYVILNSFRSVEHLSIFDKDLWGVLYYTVIGVEDLLHNQVVH